ncbi:MAG: hypothetical protein ACFFDW_07820 [Candidatus Thorarchaeota archaeon]
MVRKKSTITGLIISGMILVVIFSSLSISFVNSRVIIDDEILNVYTITTKVGEGYINPSGESGDWLPSGLVSLHQLVLRPGIPGKMTQENTQYSINQMKWECQVEIEGSYKTEVGLNAVASSSVDFGLDLNIQGGQIYETRVDETTTIELNYDSINELAFSASIYSFKVNQYATNYKISTYVLWASGVRELIATKYRLDIQTKILDAQEITYRGISFDYDNVNHRSLFPFIADIYEDILAGSYTESSKTEIWGDALTTYAYKVDSSVKNFWSVSLKVSAEWGAELGFAGCTTETSIKVTIGGTYAHESTTGTIDVSTFTSGFQNTGQMYLISLNSLSLNALRITGQVYTPPILP